MNNPAIRRLFSRISGYFDTYLHSAWYMVFCAVVSMVGFLFRQDMLAVGVMLVLMCVNLVFVQDILPIVLPTTLVVMIPMQYSSESFDEIYQTLPLLLMLLPCLLARICIYHKKFRLDSFGRSLIPYATGLMLAGIGTRFFVLQYTTILPLYTMIGLGWLQLVIYTTFCNHVTTKKEFSLQYIARSMCALSAVAIVMIVTVYLKQSLTDGHIVTHFIFFPWKNYVADIIVLSLPFTFFLAEQSKKRYPYYLFSIFQYLAVFATQSGGGILVCTAEIACLYIYSILRMPAKERKRALIAVSMIAVVLLALIIWQRQTLYELYLSKINTGGSARTTLYDIALKEFAEHPILGVGYGYVNTFMMDTMRFDMAYFHSTVFQNLACGGVIGIATYAYVANRRLNIYLRPATFNRYWLIGYLAFSAYAIVDVAFCLPLPFVGLTSVMAALCNKAPSTDGRFDYDRQQICIDQAPQL